MSALGSGLPEPRVASRRRSALIAVVAVALLAIAIALFSRREASQIPVPGEPAVEVMTPQPLATEVPPSRVQATPAQRAAAREPEARREPERAGEPERPRELAPPPEEPEPPRVEGGRGARALHTGWYRVKFRAPLFQSPSETAPVVTYIPPGTRVRVTEVMPGFLRVESTTGKPPGYLSTDDAAAE